MDSITIWKIIAQGFISIILGILIFYFAYKQKESRLFSAKFKGYLAGGFFILLGIIHLINELHIW
jgi:uncharacterized membrane protein HdeD (DUF308 family)